MTEPYVKRLRRLLLLIPVAARASVRGRGVPLARAAEITGARSAAEVAKDVEAVQTLWQDPAEAEEPIDLHVENGEIFLTYPTALEKPRAFSLAEGAVLLAALAPFEEDGGRPVREAIRKLRKAIPEPLRAEADRLARGLDLGLAPEGPWAGALREAIAGRIETSLEYRAVADASIARRTVLPRLVFHRDGAWYLAAWNVEKDAEHLFRLDRVVSVELGTRRFDGHRGPPLERYGRGGRLFFPSGEEREVTLRLSGASARLASARYGTRARENPDGTASVTTRLTRGEHLLGVVLGHGGEATVEAPADLAAALADRVGVLSALYGR